ncbi:MAG: phage tail tube protein [Anaerovoracaceae bacterium]
MSKFKMDKNKIINGTHGKVFFDNEKLTNIKKGEVKITLDYEEVSQSEVLGTGSRYMGYSIAGTLVLHKLDSFIASKLEEGIKTGNMPEFTVIMAIEDPAAYGYERIELTGVTIDEVSFVFENKALGEEEVPFKASNFRYLDKIA